MGGTSHARPTIPFGQVVSFLLLEDEIFQRLMLIPRIHALPTFKLGLNCAISAFQAIIKGQDGPELDLHADELTVPPPFAVNAGGVNVTYIMTDYTVDDGCLCYVPGSHMLYRQPVGREGHEQRVPVEAKAGSAIVWAGNLWHGAYARRKPGLRISLSMFFARPHMRPQEDYRADITAQMLAKFPPRFRSLVAKDNQFGWREKGPVLDGRETLIGSSPYR